MEEESSKSKNSSYWVIVLFIALLFIVVAFIFYQQEEKSAKEIEETLPSHNRWEQHDNNRRQNDPPANRKDNSSKEEQQFDPNQDFIEKGYSKKDIETLKYWGLEANKVPDLKVHKRKGIINTLGVDSVDNSKGSCSELVIILKKSLHVKADILNYKKGGLSSMKIKQSREFADTEDNNRAVIKFAIDKIVEEGHTWEYDVYVLKANSNVGTISGPSAGSGVYLALISAFYSDCAIPKNLAITGALDTEKKEITTENKPILKKYQWQTNRCAQCNNRSKLYHFIYDKTTGKLEKNYLGNATNPDSEWVFCNWKCYNEWREKNVYNCSKCGQQRFGNCSCCGKYHSWIRESNDSEVFCSKECVDEYYPKTYEEGKIVGIDGIRGKITAAVEKGCDTIIISKENSSDYYDKIPLSIQAKVKKLCEVENYKDLQNLFPF